MALTFFCSASQADHIMSSIDPTLQNHAKGEFDLHTFPGMDVSVTASALVFDLTQAAAGRVLRALAQASGV